MAEQLTLGPALPGAIATELAEHGSCAFPRPPPDEETESSADGGAYMVPAWLAINNLFLFLCASMYLGTGWSLVLFSFPSASKLHPGNYYDQFVPQVTAATKFFTVMTVLMVASAIAMIIGDPAGGYWVLGAIVLAAVVAATVLTVVAILPDNRKMAAGIKTQAELDTLLRRWMARNRIRVGLWTVQWSAMAIWFGLKVT
jgi:hypothetical protein